MQPGPDYMSWAQGSLAEISIPSLNAIKKNQLCDYMTTERARLAWIPVL